MSDHRININRLIRVAFKSGRAGFVASMPYPVLVPRAVQRGVLEDSPDAGSTLLHLPQKGGDVSIFEDPRVIQVRFPVRANGDATISLGRTLQTDIALSDFSVGLEHAIFRQREDETWELEDQGSKNGTFVDDLRLIPGVPMAIESKQELRFGRVHLHFYSPNDMFDALMAAGGA